MSCLKLSCRSESKKVQGLGGRICKCLLKRYETTAGRSYDAVATYIINGYEIPTAMFFVTMARKAVHRFTCPVRRLNIASEEALL